MSIKSLSPIFILYSTLFIYFYVLTELRSMRDLSSLTRDRTHAYCSEVVCLNHWISVEVTSHFYFKEDSFVANLK